MSVAIEQPQLSVAVFLRSFPQLMNQLNRITGTIVKKAWKVHEQLGPGLLESAYQNCLAYELVKEGLKVEMEKAVPLVYEEVKLNCGFRVDILVEEKVVVEVKAVEAIAPVHVAQVVTYLKLLNLSVGLLLNFHVVSMKEGIKRIVHNFQE